MQTARVFEPVLDQLMRADHKARIATTPAQRNFWLKRKREIGDEYRARLDKQATRHD
jgi:uncharacterized NAD(P)/FAD-binding protein YdhS